MIKESRIPRKALEGVKVVAFIQGITGPLTASGLAAYGAEVIRIETQTRLEWHRQAGPFIGNVSTPDRAVPYLCFNSGERAITLNLKAPKAMDIMRRIVKWADVIVENFSGSTMDSLGLGYKDLLKIKPDIIMLSAAIYGQKGPFAHVRGYGLTLTALTGMPAITGFPDQLPQFPGFAITDFIAPRANILAIVAALDYRARTGKGQYLDAAQAESAFPLLTPVILEYQANGHEAERMGNRSSSAAPHGLYRCQGENRWCTITVMNDEQWEKFCQVIGKPDWVSSPKFGTLLGRLKNVDELDRLVESWTLQHTPEAVMKMMQAAGVPAGVVQSGQDLDKDPQVAGRGLFWKLETPEIGAFSYTGMPFKLSLTPYEVKRAPKLGEDNESFYIKTLGLTDEEFVQYMADGVFE
jgi:benzylsuccinate CoA-transferase BbsF subunit